MTGYERNGATPIEREHDRGGSETPRVTIRLPNEKQLDRLDRLVERGEYANRSEAIREGIRRVVERERVVADGGEWDV